MYGVTIFNTMTDNPIEVVIEVYNQQNKPLFSLMQDGSGKFSEAFDETEAVWVLKNNFAYRTGVNGYNTFRFENGKGGLLVESMKKGTIKFGPMVKDKRLVSLFEKMAYVQKCECGSDKCGLPRHSPWCPKST